ncbi:alpha/beta hydrolase [Nocardioides plantarum]|uniref:Alpha/beta hydrolase n=1 Tax=Nocardioides plantarum TaxID=29299 RepID=A0ABV5KE43_9ACTN|nr:alpha/beta hydrolase [Nocardioides plantarum]
MTTLVVLALASCGGAPETTSSPAGDSSGQTISVAGSPALRWGEGDYGVVLAHGAAFDAASWEEQAVAIADQGATVVAVEDIDSDAIRAAVELLQDQGVADVALVGASAGADAILDLASQDPGLADQLILLSPNATVDGLGEEPKLFVASEDEPVANVSTELAASSPGEENEVTILPGSAHAQNIFATDQAGPVLEAMLQRLKRFAAP